MGFCIKIFYIISISIISLILLLCFVPGLPPHENFDTIQIPFSQELKENLSPNNYLNFVEKLHEGLIEGPESIAIKNNQEIFVGLLNGDIAKIWGPSLENLKVVSKTICDKSKNICGRPLGMRYLSDNTILVADADIGIYTFDAKSGDKKMIISIEDTIENKMPLVINDLDIDKEGNIYWSHSCRITNLTSAMLDVFVGPNGRLIRYNPNSKISTVLMDKLYFANGVQLSPDESFVLVSESMRKTVQRYWIKGSQKGESDIFISNLPGTPDNIRPRPEGGYYISLISTVDSKDFDFMVITGRYPSMRRIIARLLIGVKAVTNWIENIFPNKCTRSIYHSIFHFQTAGELFGSNNAIVLEVDNNGNILSSFQGRSGKIKFISETQRIGDTLLFGSPYMKFLGKLDLVKLEKQKRYQKFVPETDTKYEL